MPQDVIKTKGPLKSANPGVGGGATKNFPVFGIVKDNIDPTRSGRIKVLLGEKSPQDSDNSSSWVTVSYMSNFFGKIGGQGGGDALGDYTSNPTSYGEWHAPPDIGTKVVCIFINGDPNYGFYIGCVPEPEMLQMVPAIGSSDKIVANEGESKGYGGAIRLPVTNLNTNNKAMADSGAFNDSPRPVHSYTASIMNQQGIIRDPIRGPISSSASREASSRVGWGVSTPGRPIYEGGYDDATIAKNLDQSKAQQLKVIARRGGHSIVMDDGDIIGRDQLIRIRTALGHQILMSDDGQTLMILHSNGQSYIELGKEGTVDIFSTNSFNVRTQGDINFHADRNINLHAKENLSIQAKNIQTNSEEKTKMRAGSDINLASVGKITGLAGGAVAWGAGADASIVAGGQAYVNGSKVNLNSGAPGTSPDAVGPLPLVAQTDTLYDEEKGFIAAPGKLLTIASRAPAHAPWANAGQGVDIKTSMNAADNLPKTAPPAAAATSEKAAANNPEPPAVATVASAPAAVPPVSAAVDKNTTAATVAATATDASKGPLAAATKEGAAIVPTDQGQVCAVGSFALTPAQLEQGGALKPGAATLVTAMTDAGKKVEQAMPKNLFTGLISGVKSVTKLVQNVAAQATTLVNTFQKAQSALSAVGILSGKESPTQVAGMVNATATVGLGAVVDVVRDTANAAKATVGAVNSIGNALENIGVIGNANAAAAGAANSLTGATNTTANLVKNVTGAVASGVNAVNSIAAVGSSITKSANSLTGKLSGPVGGAVAGAVGAATGAIGQAAGAVSGAINDANAAIGKVNGAISDVAGAVNKADAALKAIGSGDAAAKLTQQIGGLGGIQSALTAMGRVPTLTSLVNQAEGVATSAYNAIKKSFKDLKPNVPQNLTQIAKENAAAAATVASTTGEQAQSGVLNSIKNAADAVGDAVSGVKGAVSSISNTVSSVTGAVNGAVNSVSSAVNSVTGAVSSVTGSVKSLTNAVGSVNNSISSISGAVNTTAAALSTVATNATAATTTINNITAVASTTPDIVVGNALNTTIGGIENAVNNVSAIAGAGATIANGGLQALSNAASAVQSGAQAAISATMASGLSNLPGGINTVASITNNAANALNAVPGTGALSSAIKEATTSVMNGVSTVNSATKALSGAVGDVTKSINGVSNAVSGAINDATGAINDVAGGIDKITGAAGDIANKVDAAIDDAAKALTSAVGSVQGTLNSLTSLASIGLPAGAIAQLQSSIASLSNGIPGSINLPAVGFNTTDRASLGKQILSLLGNPKIPSPNLLGEIAQETKDSIDDAKAKNKAEYDRIMAEAEYYAEETVAKKRKYFEIRDEKGENDPATIAAKKEWTDILESPGYIKALKEFNVIFESTFPPSS